MSGATQTTPGYMIRDGEKLTEAILRMIANPVVQIAEDAITEREIDMAALVAALGNNVRPNLLTNGNFTEERFVADTIEAAAGVDTVLAQGWFAQPQGAALTYSKGTTAPDANSFTSALLTGAVGATTVEFGQNILRSASALMWQKLTFSAWIHNNTGAIFTPKLILSTADAVNDFTAVTEQENVELETCPNEAWTLVQWTFDAGGFANREAGLRLALHFPAGTLNAGGKTISIAKAKLEVGEAVTPMPWDPNTDLSDGSVTARKLATNAVETAKIKDAAVTEDKLAAGVVSTAKLGALAVTTEKMAALAITAEKLAAGAVTKEKLDATALKITAKAWVNFDGSTGTIRSSYNVSSVTKNGTGDYTINFTTAMADINYAVVTGASGDTRMLVIANDYPGNPLLKTVNAVRVGSAATDRGGFYDTNGLSLAILGN